MGQKRKWEETKPDGQTTPTVTRPKAGTKAYVSGKAVKDGLATGSPQAFVSFRQQIVTPYSTLPIPITHPAVVILQHYLDASPTCEEIFKAWQIGHETKNESQTHAAVELLSEIISILTSIPFFRSSVIGLVNKVIAPTEHYHDYLSRLVSSGRRDDVYHGLLLSAACINVDPPTPSSSSSSTGRVSMKLWSVLVEGGSVRSMGKQLGMRRRNKEGMVAYGEGDPLDRPDIRHLALKVVLPLLSTSALHAHARIILPPLYSGLSADPPVTVCRVLTSLWNAISGQTAGLSRKTSLVLFQEKSVEHLWQLLSREDREESTGRTVAELVSAFLEGITCSPGKGICFPDEGWYARRIVDPQTGLEVQADQETPGAMGDDERYKKGLHNRILANVVRKVGNKVVDDDGLVGEWVIKVFKACPELVSGYWPHSALAVDPRLSARWIATMAYIGRIISLPPPKLDTFRQAVTFGMDVSDAPFRSQPPALTVMVESIFPSPLTKAHLMKGLQHSDTLVQHMTAITLARGLQKLAIVQDLFSEIEAKVGEEPSTSRENPWTSRRRELEMEIRKRVPELSVIIAFAQKAATMAPAEAETEVELALAAKSTMLTEVGLRLLGLCNKALPSMASDMKFDVGRLLVSASSASAERRARREAREGSVISDSGSVASVGTMGTAGMGGGFGQARGDVEGFEALSQLHVLQLLSEVKEWNWMNKAAGSQYTYLYHILLLRLSTHQPITYLKTTSLLHHLLLPTLLFEHDTPELSIWLDALPRASETVSGPMLLAQQIHLLSFLDDCFRRCVKTPYRYIEDSFALVPEFFAYTRPGEMLSPVLMTVLEQLSAKMMGQLISTEAAAVIMNYIGRVLLGLTSKQGDLKFIFAVVKKMEEMLKKATDASQGRVGLDQVLKAIDTDLGLVAGKKGVVQPSSNNNDIPRLLDDGVWTRSSFEKTVLTTEKASWLDFDRLNLLVDTFASSADDATLLRRARFVLHVLSGTDGLLNDSSSRGGALSFLNSCLKAVKADSAKDQMKRLIFVHDSIRVLFLSSAGDEYRTELNNVNAHLRARSAADCGLAQAYITECVELIEGDKKAKNARNNLLVLAPWTRFLKPAQAKTALERLLKRPERVGENSSSETLKTISQVVLVTHDPAFAVKHLTPLIQLGATSSIIGLIRIAAQGKNAHSHLVDLNVKKSTVQELLTTDNDEAYELLSTLVAVSVPAGKAALKLLASKEVSDPRLLPTLEVLLEVAPESQSRVISLAFTTIKNRASTSTLRNSAFDIIARIVSQPTSAINSEISAFKLIDYDVHLAGLTEVLVRSDPSGSAVSHLLALGLQWATRLASSDKEIPEDDFDTLKAFSRAISSSQYVQIPQELVEPVITAVIQDRLEVTEAVDLATLLATRCELKASFIRQHLQILLDSPSYTECISITPPTSLRRNFTGLLHALFSASTYISCQPSFVEPLLALYRGTLSISDRRVLHLFQLFEGYRKISVASILKHWSATGVVGNNKRAFDAVTSLDAGRVFAACQNYPLRRPLRSVGSTVEEKNGDSLYDPVFVISLFVATMSEGGLSGLDWVEILRSNILGLTICGLSSRDKEVRETANYALAKAFSLIESTPFLERPQLVYALRLLKHSITSSHTRLPTITSLFFAHVLRSLANPSHFLYPLTSRFLLQRPVYDAQDVPMLYAMLYASGDGFKRERGWIARLLKEGVRSEADWRVVRRRKTWSLLATLFSSALDPAYRRTLLQAMESMIAIPAAARSLVLRDGLFTWLLIQWVNIDQRLLSAERRGIKSHSWEREEKSSLLVLARNACQAMCVAAEERLKEGKDVGDWTLGVSAFIKKVLKGDVDRHRLVALTKMVYRLSELPDESTADLLPRLVDKLVSLESSETEEITALLFRAGLNLSPEDLARESYKPTKNGVGEAEGLTLAEAVAELDWRAEKGDAGVEVMEWVRKERRLISWEQRAKE